MLSSSGEGVAQRSRGASNTRKEEKKNNDQRHQKKTYTKEIKLSNVYYGIQLQLLTYADAVMNDNLKSNVKKHIPKDTNPHQHQPRGK